MLIQKEKLGKLEVDVCKYKFKPNTKPMERFSRIYLHGTIKHNDIDGLLNYHLSRGFAGIGYHFALKSDGTIFSTRPLSMEGAHTYGKNKGSVGILIFDINSHPTQSMLKSFKDLYRELNGLASIELPLHSHTYGQFEYLNDRIVVYNTELPEKIRFRMQDFDDSSMSDSFARQKDDLVNQLIILRKIGIPTYKQKDFQMVSKLIDQLKLCPANQFNLFADVLRG